MRYKKTPQDKRSSYKLFDDNGNFVTEYKAGENGVTEVDILNLHKIDDHEAYINNKERRLPECCKEDFEKWRKSYAEKFSEKYGREPKANEIPYGHRQFISIEAQLNDDDDSSSDKGCIWERLSYVDFEDKPAPVMRLYEIVEDMPERWQQVYQLVHIEGYSKTKAGDILGISDVRVGQIVRKINEKIKNDRILKKIFE